jgi:hypothetical protein
LEQTTQPPIELVPAHKKRWTPRLILLFLILIAGFWLKPFLLSSLQTGAGFALDLVYFLAYLFAVVMLPLMFFALMSFGYRVFARPYVRVWHINRIRNQRHLKEVIRRNRE